MTDERNWSCWRGEAGADREEMTRRCATPRGEQRCRYRARRARVASWAGCPSRVRPIPNSYCTAMCMSCQAGVWSRLLSHARKALCLLILTIVMCGAVKTRIGPDMCARRRGRVSFLDVFQHTEPHTSERVTTRQVSGFQSDLAEDTCSRTNCAQPFAVEGYALGPSV